MNSGNIRQKFLMFFKERGHSIVPSSSLVPDDASVLLTTAGMQQFKKYFTGELDPVKDFKSKNTVSVQKCFRTSDIDEVGDESHLTFFEMLGNFSFGGPDASGKVGASYWKKEAIQYGYEFFTKVMKLDIDYVTVFDPVKVLAGDWRKGVLFDEESYAIWKKILPESKIRRAGVDNFWGPTGNEGPCGPTTEIYISGLEIWNIVFNQFYCDASKKLTPLKIQGVDTGMGLERLAMVAQKKKNIFETDLFEPIVAKLPAGIDERIGRIFADHIRGIAFLISDGVRPSNKETGYVLRRLMRRLMVYGVGWAMEPLFEVLAKHYPSEYKLSSRIITDVYRMECEKFSKTLSQGLRELERLETVSAVSAFKLYESFGLPYEIIKERGGRKADELTREAFDAEFKKHQEISRAGQGKKFGGHGLLLDTGELKAKDEAELKKVTRLHTATHMLQQALREVLGQDVKQMGSDITALRTRFDFTFPRKLTPEEIKKVEALVNEKIKENLPIQKAVLPKAEAEKTGALYFFKEKYPDPVNVYFIGRDLNSAWSKEFCGGPHVTHTGEIGKFKIIKEEAVGAGIRRVRGIVIP